jgi:hypothetical protein
VDDETLRSALARPAEDAADVLDQQVRRVLRRPVSPGSGAPPQTPMPPAGDDLRHVAR